MSEPGLRWNGKEFVSTAPKAPAAAPTSAAVASVVASSPPKAPATAVASAVAKPAAPAAKRQTRLKLGFTGVAFAKAKAKVSRPHSRAPPMSA